MILIPIPLSYVLLHGLNGHPQQTWTAATGFFWPWEIRTELKNSRMMLYGYNADVATALTDNQASIKSIASSFLSELMDDRERDEVNALFAEDVLDKTTLTILGNSKTIGTHRTQPWGLVVKRVRTLFYLSFF